MTTYLFYLTVYLASRWDREEGLETSKFLDGMAAGLTEKQCDYLEEIIWKTYPA